MFKFITTSLLILILCTGVCFGGVTFDGVDDFINIGTSSTYEFTDSTFTVCGWFKATTQSGYIISKRDTNVNGGWFIRVESDGKLTGRLLGPGAAQVAAQRSTTSTTGLDGNPHHFCFVFVTDTVTAGPNDMTIYYDGTQDQGSETNTGVAHVVGATIPVYLGAYANLSDTFLSGTIDEITVYSVGLSAENANRLYNSRLKYNHAQGTLKSYWPLDDCAHNASGDGVTFNDRGPALQNGTGDNGGNNTGLTCVGSSYLMYQGGVE